MNNAYIYTIAYLFALVWVFVSLFRFCLRELPRVTNFCWPGMDYCRLNRRSFSLLAYETVSQTYCYIRHSAGKPTEMSQRNLDYLSDGPSSYFSQTCLESPLFLWGGCIWFESPIHPFADLLGLLVSILVADDVTFSRRTVTYWLSHCIHQLGLMNWGLTYVDMTEEIRQRTSNCREPGRWESLEDVHRETGGASGPETSRQMTIITRGCIWKLHFTNQHEDLMRLMC